MAITGVVARVRVDDLEAAVPFYEGLEKVKARRFSFGSAALASIGSFLLFAAPGEDGDRLAKVAATLTTDDLDAQLAEVQTLGASVVAPATSTPNGRRAIVRHPDGVVVEYVGR